LHSQVFSPDLAIPGRELVSLEPQQAECIRVADTPVKENLSIVDAR